MSVPYINHITLTTGHCNRSGRDQVMDETLAILRPWIAASLAAEVPVPLPVTPLAHFSGRCIIDDGALVCTIYAPGGPHVAGQPTGAEGFPLVTLGVAQRSRHGGDLWALMLANFGAYPAAKRPAEPWCAVALHSSLAAYPEATRWLGDLERCIAWAWITRRPTLEVAP
jgi:hypothetical protein